ncbi:MAG TPA: glucose-6-phosphate dehydrogenase assembly protein OpcA [Candidatus Limnocylindrales bacterium]
MAADLTAGRPTLHSLPEIESQLGVLWASARKRTAGEGEHHVAARSNVLNLVVVAGHRETAERCAATIAGTAGRHPSRSLILSTADIDGPAGLDAHVQILSVPTPAARGETDAEMIYATVHGDAGRHLASLIVPLLVHDLPVALWWPHDPQFGSHRADRLLPIADRLIVDGSSWSGNGLDRLAEMARQARSRGLVVADFSLLKQSRWREAIASVYDLPDLRPHLRAVRSIKVEYAAAEDADSTGLTNVVRPVYHVAWLASRLGMSVVSPLRREDDGRRTATLRQGNHRVAVELQPVCSDLSGGSTVRVEIASRLRGAELVGDVSATDHAVDVVVRDKGRERARRAYIAPRLNDVDLLLLAVEDSSGAPVAAEALAMAGQLAAVSPRSHETTERRRSQS